MIVSKRVVCSRAECPAVTHVLAASHDQNASLQPELRLFEQASGGEDILLNEFDGLGLHCDPLTQLVVTCEVCRRPATKECWTCQMQICDFCTLKRHWKVKRVKRQCTDAVVCKLEFDDVYTCLVPAMMGELPCTLDSVVKQQACCANAAWVA